VEAEQEQSLMNAKAGIPTARYILNFYFYSESTINCLFFFVFCFVDRTQRKEIISKCYVIIEL